MYSYSQTPKLSLVWNPEKSLSANFQIMVELNRESDSYLTRSHQITYKISSQLTSKFEMGKGVAKNYKQYVMYIVCILMDFAHYHCIIPDIFTLNSILYSVKESSRNSGGDFQSYLLMADMGSLVNTSEGVSVQGKRIG